MNYNCFGNMYGQADPSCFTGDTYNNPYCNPCGGNPYSTWNSSCSPGYSFRSSGNMCCNPSSGNMYCNPSSGNFNEPFNQIMPFASGQQANPYDYGPTYPVSPGKPEFLCANPCNPCFSPEKTVLIPQPPKICFDKEVTYHKRVVPTPTVTHRWIKLDVTKPRTVLKPIKVPKIIWQEQLVPRKDITHEPYWLKIPQIIQSQRFVYEPKICVVRKVCPQKPIYVKIPSSCRTCVDACTMACMDPSYFAQPPREPQTYNNFSSYTKVGPSCSPCYPPACDPCYPPPNANNC